MTIAAGLSLALAGCGITYLILAAATLLRLPGSRRSAPDGSGGSLPPVSILRPLHGDEAGLYENLASSLRQDYPAAIQLVLGLQNAADPALAVARRVEADFPDRDIEIVVDATLHGENRKVSNLINMAARARHGTIVLADSDMRVGPGYLRDIAAELARPGVGAVTCLYHGIPVGGLWSRLATLWIDAYFMPSVVLGSRFGLAKPCMGSTIALSREVLDRIGGFPALADDLADDYELGRRVRDLGLDVAVTGFTIGHVCQDVRLSDLLGHELRWARTTRQIEPLGYLGSLVTHPAAFAALALLLDPGPWALACLAAALAARVVLCLAAERAFGLRPHPYWLIPLRDALAIVIFVVSFLGRRVTWRGRRYGVARSGALLSETRI